MQHKQQILLLYASVLDIWPRNIFEWNPNPSEPKSHKNETKLPKCIISRVENNVILMVLIHKSLENR